MEILDLLEDKIDNLMIDLEFDRGWEFKIDLSDKFKIHEALKKISDILNNSHFAITLDYDSENDQIKLDKESI